MKTIATALFALAAITMSTAAFAADTKICKAGQVLNPETGKCVTKRGS